MDCYDYNGERHGPMPAMRERLEPFQYRYLIVIFVLAVSLCAIAFNLFGRE